MFGHLNTKTKKQATCGKTKQTEQQFQPYPVMLRAIIHNLICSLNCCRVDHKCCDHKTCDSLSDPGWRIQLTVTQRCAGSTFGRYDQVSVLTRTCRSTYKQQDFWWPKSCNWLGWGQISSNFSNARRQLTQRQSNHMQSGSPGGTEQNTHVGCWRMFGKLYTGPSLVVLLQPLPPCHLLKGVFCQSCL